MAISFSLILLLVALITTAATTTTPHRISATKTLPPSKPASPPTTPPPPPPSALAGIQETHLNNIIDALIGAGDFAGWANFLSTADSSSLPLDATFFIPGNDAVSNLSSANASGISFDTFLIPYHIVPQRLTFLELQRFKIHALLPTLLHAKYIVITNNTPANFTVDDSQIMQPDIFVNAAFAVHGVKKVLDYSVYGDGRVPSPPQENTTSPKSTPEPPNKRNPVLPGDISFGLRSSANGFQYYAFLFFLPLLLYSRFFEISLEYNVKNVGGFTFLWVN